MTRLIAAIAVLCVALWWMAGPIFAHESPAGWEYDAACCSNKDCAPIEDVEVEEVAGGFFLKARQEFVPFAETKQGKDDHYHLCVNQFNGTRLCFYRKYSGS